MIEYFVQPLAGVRTRLSFDELMGYRGQRATRFRARPPGVVDGPVGPGTLDLPSACSRARALASRPFKFTLTGPHRLAKMLLNRHYRDSAELAHAIGDALAAQVRHLDADVVQVDEANLPGSPDEWQWAASAMNRVLDAVPKSAKAAVHLCFGNYGGQSIQKGSWAKLIDYLNALHVDHIVMECAHRPQGEMAGFKSLRPGIGLGIGVVGIKATRGGRAGEGGRPVGPGRETVGAGRLRYVHPDCGFWMLKRNMADGKMKALVAGRDLYEGRSTQQAA